MVDFLYKKFSSRRFCLALIGAVAFVLDHFFEVGPEAEQAWRDFAINVVEAAPVVVWMFGDFYEKTRASVTS
jgi:hypothetical protein